MPVIWLEPEPVEFPAVGSALTEPNGLLAAGGELNIAWLELAYSQGIFPWFESGQPILWWSPDPRMVLYPEELYTSRSLRKLLRKEPFQVTFDTCFSEVIEACSESRAGMAGTWITDSMKSAYIALHDAGTAHSVEVWSNRRLVGGLYGVAKGKVFFGESMFSRQDNASKVAFVYLVEQLKRWGFQLIDCQVSSEHLISLGASEISRKKFSQHLKSWVTAENTCEQWKFQSDLSLIISQS